MKPEEVALKYNMSVSVVRLRSKILKIQKTNKKYIYTPEDVERILNFGERIPKIIYVTQTFLILPSKMNF